jgi:hypothetical protein
MNHAYEENINCDKNDINAVNLVEKVEILSEKQTMSTNLHLREHVHYSLESIFLVRTSVAIHIFLNKSPT